MKHYIILMCFSSFLILSIAATAQNKLSGTILDSHDNAPLKGVAVSIPDIKTGAISDSSGRYHIKNIPEGTYLVEIALTGYATKLETVIIKGTPQKDYSIDRSATELKDVIVTGVISATDKQQTPISITTVDSKYLLENSSTNVIDAISKVPGVSAMTDGQSISKPVIRGLGYNRVLTVNDGG
jgi:iron complex outermembrane recepter protein